MGVNLVPEEMLPNWMSVIEASWAEFAFGQSKRENIFLSAVIHAQGICLCNNLETGNIIIRKGKKSSIFG